MKQADIIVYGPDRTLQLVVEVKNGLGASEEWAREVRDLLLQHRAIPASPYFLLAMTNRFYLWGPGTAGVPRRLPEYAIDVREALEPYTRALGRPLENVSKPGFELLVSSWLVDLMHSDPQALAGCPGLSGLLDSGLFAAIRRGSLDLEAEDQESREAIAAQYWKAYEGGAGLGPEFDGWVDQGAWPSG
ncbi:MAG TPA: hypothetical protein VLQ45_17735 [Thermoanaerobaculia bacterium]|nr:hypothetical protein [Thermoanaerobaculia bacterium]